MGGLLFCGSSGSGITVSRNFDQKSRYCRLSVSNGQIFLTQILSRWKFMASTDAGATKNIALTAAVANIKFFANLVMWGHSLLKFICAELEAVQKFFACRRVRRGTVVLCSAYIAASDMRVFAERNLFAEFGRVAECLSAARIGDVLARQCLPVRPSCLLRFDPPKKLLRRALPKSWRQVSCTRLLKIRNNGKCAQADFPLFRC